MGKRDVKAGVIKYSVCPQFLKVLLYLSQPPASLSGILVPMRPLRVVSRKFPPLSGIFPLGNKEHGVSQGSPGLCEVLNLLLSVQ